MVFFIPDAKPPGIFEDSKIETSYPLSINFVAAPKPQYPEPIMAILFFFNI